MKTVVFEDNYRKLNSVENPSWYIVADSAISNTGKPFYIPEECGPVTVSLSIAVKFQRLGKYIDPKFSHRYYHEYAPAVHFRLPELRRNLEENKQPLAPSYSFDKSIIIADFKPLETDFEDISAELHIDGESRLEWRSDHLKESLDRLIHRFSKMNTIKMGDIMLPALSGCEQIQEGDFIEILVDSQRCFNVKIK